MDSCGVRLTWFDCKSVLGPKTCRPAADTRRKLLVAREKKPLVSRVSNDLNSLNNGAMGGGGGRGAGGGGWGDVCTQATQWAIEEFRFKSLHSSFCLQFGDWIL